MRVAVSGSSGFVGRSLVELLLRNGDTVIRLVRHDLAKHSSSSAKSSSITNVKWDPRTDCIDTDKLEEIGIDAIVNLAGENVHQKWSQESRTRMIDSRIRSTTLLAKTIARLKQPPSVFVSASGISYYLDTAAHSSQKLDKKRNCDCGDKSALLDESSPAGSGFFSELAQIWEKASKLESDFPDRTRVVNLRIGIVLGTEGGMLGKLLPLFRIGLGGKLGDGKQCMSWISIDDMVRAIYFTITNDTFSGPVNAVAPTPISNDQFTRTLGKVLSRPTLFKIPSRLLEMAYGTEWTRSTILADYRLKPGMLLKHGFEFKHPDLDGLSNN